MSDSGFDTLNTFKTDLVIEPVRPVDPVPNVQGGTFEVTPPVNYEEKNQTAAEIASQAVDQTPAYNNLALQNADQFLPVRDALPWISDANELDAVFNIFTSSSYDADATLCKFDSSTISSIFLFRYCIASSYGLSLCVVSSNLS